MSKNHLSLLRSVLFAMCFSVGQIATSTPDVALGFEGQLEKLEIQFFQVKAYREKLDAETRELSAKAAAIYDEATMTQMNNLQCAYRAASEAGNEDETGRLGEELYRLHNQMRRQSQEIRSKQIALEEEQEKVKQLLKELDEYKDRLLREWILIGDITLHYLEKSQWDYQRQSGGYDRSASGSEDIEWTIGLQTCSDRWGGAVNTPHTMIMGEPQVYHRGNSSCEKTDDDHKPDSGNRRCKSTFESTGVDLSAPSHAEVVLRPVGASPSTLKADENVNYSLVIGAGTYATFEKLHETYWSEEYEYSSKSVTKGKSQGELDEKLEPGTSSKYFECEEALGSDPDARKSYCYIGPKYYGTGIRGTSSARGKMSIAKFSGERTIKDHSYASHVGDQCGDCMDPSEGILPERTLDIRWDFKRAPYWECEAMGQYTSCIGGKYGDYDNDKKPNHKDDDADGNETSDRFDRERAEADLAYYQDLADDGKTKIDKLFEYLAIAFAGRNPRGADWHIDQGNTKLENRHEAYREIPKIEEYLRLLDCLSTNPEQFH